MTSGTFKGPDARPALPGFREGAIADYCRAAGLKALHPLWAKTEILLGLSAAAAGLRLMPGATEGAVLGGALIVLGLYLAMAGHRSHLYMAMNRQAAYLLLALGGREPRLSATVSADAAEDP